MDEKLTANQEAQKIARLSLTALCDHCSPDCPINIISTATNDTDFKLEEIPHCYKGDGGRRKQSKLMDQIMPDLTSDEIAKELDNVLSPFYK
jgi:hypothetical protein